MPRPGATTTSPRCRAGCCRAWSTPTATSAWAPGVPCGVRRAWAAAHSHMGRGAGGAVDDETAQAQAIAARDAGALLLRDAGSPADTRWVQARDDLPRLVRAGRHIARTRRYIRN